MLDTEETFFKPEVRVDEVQEIDVLIQKARSQHQERILYQCESLKILNTNHLIKLTEIYSRLKDIDQDKQKSNSPGCLRTAGEFVKHHQRTENLFSLNLKQQCPIYRYYYLINLLTECLDQVSCGEAVAGFELECLIPLARVDPEYNCYTPKISKRFSLDCDLWSTWEEVKSESLVAF